MHNQLRKFLLQYRAILILLALILVASLTTTEFFTAGNLKNVMLQVATDGIIAVGMTFVIISGGIDLSVGAVLALVSVITVLLQPVLGTGAGIIISLISSIMIGLFNGLLITRIGISPFVTTLGAMTVIKGLSLTLSGSRTHSGIDPAFANLADMPVLGIPFAAILFIVFVVIANWFLVRTALGRGFYAVGGNPEASWLAGLNVKRYVTFAYVFCSFMSGVGGILVASRINSGSPILGSDTGTSVISAVLLGGTSMAGGTGTVYGTLVGVLILGVLKNMMNLMEIGGYFQTIILGVLLIATVLADRQHFSQTNS